MKKVFSLLLSIMLIASLAPFAQAQEQTTSFKDVPSSYTFYEEIQFLVELGIIAGYEDGTFRPNQEVTRAQAAIMLARELGFENEPPTQTDFSDVSPSSVASGYIQVAVEFGIIQGFQDGTFRPNEPVTRGQLAILLSRSFDLTESEEVTFHDVSPSSAAYPYIGKLVYAGITYGYEDGTFKPNQPVTRGQFAAFMTRAIIYYYENAFPDEDFSEEDLLDEELYLN